MKLSECTMGTLVVERTISDGTPGPRRIGHVVALQVNPTGETIPVIQFATPHRPFATEAVPNPALPYHHANLDRYLDQVL